MSSMEFEKNGKPVSLKKIAYWVYYRMIRGISSINLPVDSGDFCLMRYRVVAQLNRMTENDRYIRGMRTWIGFRQTGLEYERPDRAAEVLQNIHGLCCSSLHIVVFSTSAESQFNLWRRLEQL